MQIFKLDYQLSHAIYTEKYVKYTVFIPLTFLDNYFDLEENEVYYYQYYVPEFDSKLKFKIGNLIKNHIPTFTICLNIQNLKNDIKIYDAILQVQTEHKGIISIDTDTIKEDNIEYIQFIPRYRPEDTNNFYNERKISKYWRPYNHVYKSQKTIFNLKICYEKVEPNSSYLPLCPEIMEYITSSDMNKKYNIVTNNNEKIPINILYWIQHSKFIENVITYNTSNINNIHMNDIKSTIIYSVKNYIEKNIQFEFNADIIDVISFADEYNFLKVKEASENILLLNMIKEEKDSDTIEDINTRSLTNCFFSLRDIVDTMYSIYDIKFNSKYLYSFIDCLYNL